MYSSNKYIVSNNELQKRISQGIFLLSFFVVLPIGIDHILNDRLILGIGSIIVASLFMLSTWLCFKKLMSFKFLIGLFVPFLGVFLSWATFEQGFMVLFWSYPCVIALHFVLSYRQGFIANGLFMALIFPAAWHVIEPMAMVRFVLSLMSVSGFSVIFMHFYNKQQQEMEYLVITDPLTGLLNRSLLQEKLDHMLNQNKRNGSSMTLLSLDLDFFKKINDEYGHEMGDQVLIDVSQYLKERFRGVDLVFRMGGEEFLILLFDTDAAGGLQVANEVRIAIEKLTFKEDFQVTASLGVASLKTLETQDQWLKRCDDKLYESKKNGRNLVSA